MNDGKFQSLSRDSGRLNEGLSAATILSHMRVSIPQSGFGAFEPQMPKRTSGSPKTAFQSLSRDSGRLNSRPGRDILWMTLNRVFQSLSRDSGRLKRSPDWEGGQLAFGFVSIPQSGFGAFEPIPAERLPRQAPPGQPAFQSLSRDSGRLNSYARSVAPRNRRRRSEFQSLSRDSGRLNGVPTAECTLSRSFPFQSLSRDSGRLNFVTYSLPPTILENTGVFSFNPSVGIRGV
jgi:hypothetical protein